MDYRSDNGTRARRNIAMSTLSLVRDEPRSTRSSTPAIAKIESLRAATVMAKWKDAVESVSQRAVVTIDAPLDGVTNDEVQERRSVISRSKPHLLRLEEIPLVSFEPLQEWEGRVAGINPGEKTFTATLIDITARRKYEDEFAEFPISDVSDDDRHFMRPGAIFRWLIGYERLPSGTKRRVSSVVFRRLGEWSRSDLSQARQYAEELVRGITWE